MTESDLAELIQDCPTLYHMAEGGSWPSIRRHGLLSTAALVDLFEVAGAKREAILRRHRPTGVALEHPVHGRAVVRDQKPMSDTALRGCLTEGMEPAEWYGLLNGRVFFWLSWARLVKLLRGRTYREAAHDVLELDMAELVGAYRERIMLSPINSGATFALGPVPRGPGTFQTIAEYDYAYWRPRRPRGERAVELTVDHSVPDIGRFVRRMVTLRADGLSTPVARG
jgi:hypothetical protein